MPKSHKNYVDITVDLNALRNAAAQMPGFIRIETITQGARVHFISSSRTNAEREKLAKTLSENMTQAMAPT